MATRRRRLTAVEIPLDHGAEIDVRTAGGKTAFAHAARRGFHEVVELLAARGADPFLSPPDQFAAAVLNGRLPEARAILEAPERQVPPGCRRNPRCVRSGPPGLSPPELPNPLPPI